MTYNVTLTPISCSYASASGDWAVLKKYTSSSTTNKQLLFTYNTLAEVGRAGISITSVTIHGYVRNGEDYDKYLCIGFRPASGSAVTTWASIDGSTVIDSAFKAIDAYSKSSGMAYQRFTRTFNGSHAIAKWIQQQSALGSQLYMGVIQPYDRSLSTNVGVNSWTIDITYELLGNIPSTDKTSAKLGETVTTTLNRIIESSTTTLNYKIGDNILSTVDLGTASSHEFVVPEGAGDYFPNSKTAPITVEAVTSVDSSNYGTISTSFTATLPDDTAPTISASVTRIASNDIGIYVQKQAGVKVSANATGKYGACVVKLALDVDSASYSQDGSSATFTHSSLSASGSVDVKITATDSRGYTGTFTKTITVTPWFSPTIQAFTIQRATETGTIAIDGTCAQADATASVSSLKESSTNLFRWSAANTSETYGGCTLDWDADTETFHVYGTSTLTDGGYPHWYIPSTDCTWLKNTVSGKTFTVSFTDGNTSARCLYLYIDAKKSDGTGYVLSRAYNDSSETCTATDDTVSLNPILHALITQGQSIDVYFKIQVEEGNTATPWNKYSPDEQNTLQFLIQYREIGSTDWSSADAITATDISSTISGLLTGSGTVLDSFNDMSGYEFRLGVSDLYATSYASDQMPTKEQFWDVDETTGKMGFGGDAPTSDETAGYRFHKPVEFTDAAINNRRFGWYPGDSITIPSGTVASFITSSATLIYASISVGMPIFATSVSVSGDLIIRGDKGYVDSSYNIVFPSDSYTVTSGINCSEIGLIHFDIKKSSAFTNVTNNRPLATGINSLTITFS